MPALADTSAAHVGTRRAPRFSIVAPMRFRAAHSEWLEGTTVNISRLGLLIRTGHEPPPPSTTVDVRMALISPGTRASALVACTGRVVRVSPSPATGETFMAATIDEFQIVPAASTEEHLRELGVVEKGNQQGDES